MLTRDNIKNLNLSELKASADDYVKGHLMEFVFTEVENIVRKREKGGYQYLSSIMVLLFGFDTEIML